jgi:hypothetical protein
MKSDQTVSLKKHGWVVTFAEPPQAKQKRILHEFRGLGAHLYDGTDAQAYLNQGVQLPP